MALSSGLLQDTSRFALYIRYVLLTQRHTLSGTGTHPKIAHAGEVP
jgi:hypothetical protein